jgi:hypothetical protein
MSYADKLAALTKKYLEDGQLDGEITPLLIALGCRSMFTMPNNKIHPLKETFIEDEALVTHTLLRVLRWNLSGDEPSEETSQAVLHGLSINERWSVCLADPDCAYELAATNIYLAGVIDKNSPTESAFLQVWFSEASQTIHFLLDAWLGATLPIHTPLTLDGMMVTFFGEVWTQLMWRDIAMARSSAAVVMALRPPFVEGLRTGAPDQSPMCLPPLDMT